LLKKWGRSYFSLDLGYYHKTPYLKEYLPKGYREDSTDLDYPEVERLAEWMPWNLNCIGIHCLRVRYRKKIYNKQKAASHMKKTGFPEMTERRYRESLNTAHRTITERF